MSEEKVYINSMSFKQHKFEKDGKVTGSVINVGINVEKMIEELGIHGNDRGYMNISIRKRRDQDQYGRTHYAILNTFEKKEDNNSTNHSFNSNESFDDEAPY